MSYDEIWIPSQFYSSGISVDQLTFHTTEGAMTGYSLGNWLQNPDAQVSYHSAVDNEAPGIVFRYVDTNYKAWAQAAFNPVCASVCFCAYASWSRETWLSKGWMLDNAAAIGRTFIKWFNIPLVNLSASQAQNGGRGISQHSYLGASGSGHHDCGSGFPIDVMMDKLAGNVAAEPIMGGDFMPAVCYVGDVPHFACVGADNGSIYHREGVHGTWNNVDPNSFAISGVTIASGDDGRLMITYTNRYENVCQYNRPAGDWAWYWSNLGGKSKLWPRNRLSAVGWRL
jgi:hypothetical protein